MNKYKHLLAQLQINPNDKRHGTFAGYRYGCRCFKCRVANSAHSRKYYKPRKG